MKYMAQIIVMNMFHDDSMCFLKSILRVPQKDTTFGCVPSARNAMFVRPVRAVNAGQPCLIKNTPERVELWSFGDDITVVG